jgi:hypothetical protein
MGVSVTRTVTMLVWCERIVLVIVIVIGMVVPMRVNDPVSVYVFVEMGVLAGWRGDRVAHGAIFGERAAQTRCTWRKPMPTTTRKKTTTTPKNASKRKYSRAVGETVREEIDEMKAGTLRSGGSGKKVTDRKQAIAIALSEARRSGKNVPPNPNRSAAKKKKKS